MTIAISLIVLMAISWTREDVEGFEDDEMRAAVVDEFVAQKGEKPSAEQMNKVLDAILANDMTVDDVPEQVRLALKELEDADPVAFAVIAEFREQTGQKPMLDELNFVVDAVNAGVITEDNIPDYVARIVSGELAVGAVPRNVMRLVIDSFRIHKGEKPTFQEMDVVLKAIEAGTLEVADVGDFVKDVIAQDIPEPEVPLADKPSDFDINKAIIDAYVAHAGRRPNLEELKNVRAAIKAPEEALKFVQDTVVKADVIVANVRAASDMSSAPVSEEDIDALVADVESGRKSLRDVIAYFAGVEPPPQTGKKTVADMADLDDADFVDEIYAQEIGEAPDPDTAVFLLAKLRAWDGDRTKLYNLVATMAIAVSDSDGNEVMLAFLKQVKSRDVEAAAEDYNVAQVTKRPAIGESRAPRLTSMSHAFNINLSQTDRVYLEATRRARGPSHDVIAPGQDMVLRDDVYWEFPMTKMPCPNQSCKDPDYKNAQSSLIGTFLDSAEKTNVGTLMPEFEFREVDPM